LSLSPTDDAPAPFQLAVVQLDIRLADKAYNLDRIERFTRQAAKAGAELIVFPECMLTGYCFESLEEARGLGEAADGPSAIRCITLCRELGVHVVYGYLESCGDQLFNAVALIGPRGLIGSFRKVHLPHLGVDHLVTHGDRQFPVFETELGRIGINICYDGAFPEAARIMALNRADLILLPTNWPEGALTFAQYGINTRALENTVYYASSSRIGTERGVRFIGTSRIADPFGETLAEANSESEVILTARITPALARQKRLERGTSGKHWVDRIHDRRPEFYGPIADPMS